MKFRLRLLVVISCLLVSSVACSLTAFIPGSDKPRGTIIFMNDKNGSDDLFSYNLSTQTLVRLTNNSVEDQDPTCLNKSKRIGFVRTQKDSERSDLYSMDTKGNDIQKIYQDRYLWIAYPDWSPNEKNIVASAIRKCDETSISCTYDIYVMNADGTDLARFMNSNTSYWVPRWSPDGRKIAYASDEDGDSEVYVMDKDGSNIEKLTNNSGFDGYPNWSPDGKKILFVSDRDGDWNLYLMNGDGSDPNALTTSKANEFQAAWSPDGKWIVYVSDEDQDYEVYIMDFNGENRQRITDNYSKDSMPVWCVWN